MKFATKAAHSGNKSDIATGSVNVPIYQTTIYELDDLQSSKGFSYSRLNNPTRQAFENSIAALECANHCFAFSSGMAAADAVVRLLKPGDTVLASSDLYGGTNRLFNAVFADFGIQFKYVDLSAYDELEKQITADVKMIWFESPSNPLLRILDIKRIAGIAKKHGILSCIDNTFASPYLQQPLELGIDLIVHSGTKYLAGHSDVLIGAALCNNPIIAEQLYLVQSAAGAVPGPQDCFLTIRGMKTLHLRMKAHCENAKAVANLLRSNANVEHVYWPGFEDSPDFVLAKEQMNDFGGVVCFNLKKDSVDQVRKMVAGLKVFTLAESLGGVESLVAHPATMSHATLTREERYDRGIKDATIRLSVGIEDMDDLTEDLSRALNKLNDLS